MLRIDALERENGELKTENRELKAENRQLRHSISEIENTMEERVKREAKFYGFGTGDATCGAHLPRELKGLRELYNCQWAGEFAEFFKGREVSLQSDRAVDSIF